MKKSVNKIIVASVALIVALGLAVGTSFAWFTMNNSVTVTGMLVNTQVSTNLFIADDNAAGLASTAILNQEDFGSSVTITSAATQLEPVSTTDGKHFFYTTSALADGSKENGGYKQYNYTADPSTADYSEVATPAEITAFNDAYNGIGITNPVIGYVDFVYQLKAINTDYNDAKNITITQLDLVYDDPWAAYESKAYRIAVFAQKAADHDNDPSTADTFEANSGDLVDIYATADAANHNGKAVHPSGVLTDITYNNGDPVTSVTARSTEYFKVVVRLYLEGEDTTCTNDTYLYLDQNWTLSMRFEFDSLNDAVSNLGPLYLESDGISATDTVTTTSDPAGTYYNVTDENGAHTDYYVDTETYNADTKFYKIVNVSGTDYADELLGIVAFRYTTKYVTNKAVAANANADGYYEIIGTAYFTNAAKDTFYTTDGTDYTEVVNPVTFTMVKVKVTNNNVADTATEVDSTDYYQVGDTDYYIDTPAYVDGVSKFFVLDTAADTATEVEVDATFETEPVYLLNRTITDETVTIGTDTYYKVSGSEYYVDTDTYVPGTTKFFTISGEPGSEVATVYTGEVVFTIAQ